jgi:SAM-dependent methyltransferase
MDDPRSPGNESFERFVLRARALKSPRVLELGTKRSIPTRSTRHDEWVPNAGSYVGTDIEPGDDVDIVADVHRLTAVTGEEQFDIVISCSTFEHFKYPHLAAHEVMKVMKVGGLLFVQTHQTFPLHAYPYDYFRFSREALEGLFGTKMGIRVVACDYQFPARIFAREASDLSEHQAYLNVRLFAEKTEKTPADYVYELDT